MPNISFLLKVLEKQMIHSKIEYEALGEIDGIILLKNQSSLPEHYLYILDGNKIQNTPCMETEFMHPVTIFISNGCDILPTYKSRHPVNLISTTLDLIDLYNKINKIISNYHFWTNSLMNAICDNKTLTQIVSLAASMIQAPVFILNSGFKVICRSTEEYYKDDYSEEMRSLGYLSYGRIKELFSKEKIKYRDQDILEVVLDSQANLYHINEIRHNETTIAYIFIIIDKNHLPFDLRELSTRLSNTIRRFLIEDQALIVRQSSIFSAFFADIVENKIYERGEIDNRAKFLPYPLKRYLFCLVIRFSDFYDTKDIPYRYIMNQLEEIWDRTNITIYHNDIVILHSQDKQTMIMSDSQREALNALLIQYHAYIGISYGSSNHTKLRTLYLLTLDTIRLGIPLSAGNDRRIFSYEEFSIYQIIDLSVQKYMKLHKHEDIIYLAHPSIISICRYDEEHNTNLRDVLFHYLVNDRSVVKTAQVMFMHRNTVQNKLNKISEIITIPLEDGGIQLRLVLSCMIIQYYEDYMKKDLVL